MITSTEGGDKILVVFETECIVRDRPRSLVINSDPVLPGALSVELGKEVHIELVWLNNIFSDVINHRFNFVSRENAL